MLGLGDRVGLSVGLGVTLAVGLGVTGLETPVLVVAVKSRPKPALATVPVLRAPVSSVTQMSYSVPFVDGGSDSVRPVPVLRLSSEALSSVLVPVRSTWTMTLPWSRLGAATSVAVSETAMVVSVPFLSQKCWWLELLPPSVSDPKSKPVAVDPNVPGLPELSCAIRTPPLPTENVLPESEALPTVVAANVAPMI